jgi:outer membrane protein, multidrug efflux system
VIRSYRAVGAAAALLVACRVGPNYHAPALPSGAEASLVSLDTSIETAQAPPDRWWRLYDDGRLDALVAEALKANRTLLAADAHFAAARAILTAVHANRYPSTAASAVYTAAMPSPMRFWSWVIIHRRLFGYSMT